MSRDEDVKSGVTDPDKGVPIIDEPFLVVDVVLVDVVLVGTGFVDVADVTELNEVVDVAVGGMVVVVVVVVLVGTNFVDVVVEVAGDVEVGDEDVEVLELSCLGDDVEDILDVEVEKWNYIMTRNIIPSPAH